MLVLLTGILIAIITGPVAFGIFLYEDNLRDLRERLTKRAREEE